MWKIQLGGVRAATILTAMATLMAGQAGAASYQVPSTLYPHIYDALQAAGNGDEIRVSSTYTEIESSYLLNGKSVTIRSYDPTFTTPQAGARWDSFAAGSVDSSLIEIGNGTLTIEGFGLLQAADCNVFFMQTGSNLTLKDCLVSGTVTANTAGIKSAAAATDISVNIEATTFTANGRGIWFNSIGGSTSLLMKKCAFINNSSYPIEWRTVAGDHFFRMEDSYVDTKSIRMPRFFAFNVATGQLTRNRIEFERCTFVDLPTGRYPISIAGVPDAADPASTMTVLVRNCLFDLRNGEDNLETVAINSQDDIATRRSQIDVEHTTIVFGGVNQCGFRLRENQSTLTVRNSILDAQGAGRVALRGWRGTIISQKNLLNAATVSETASGGSVVLSGQEIVGQSAAFADWAGGDFRLTSASPALQAGENMLVAMDIAGNSRPNPVNTNPDLGAYEAGVFSAVADWNLY